MVLWCEVSFLCFKFLCLWCSNSYLESCFLFWMTLSAVLNYIIFKEWTLFSPGFLNTRNVPYRVWLNPAVTGCQFSIDLLPQGMLSAASSIHAYIDINRSYKCLSKLLSFCVLVQKVFRTHEILSLIFSYYWVHFSSCY